ncbi:MAG: protein kinase domain-containing protein, partial [Planctomycetota bacterium]
SLDREVAIKVLAKHYASNDEFHQRFVREARSIAKVNHSNILQIFEVGEHDGTPFMVMEFIRGCSLAEKLKERGFIPWREASGFILQAASGLANAARNNIIHRDIKPDNLMVTEDGMVKVSDFGLAKECQGGELTHTDSIMGTPAYMSPEQCDGRSDLDSRSDMYSLGGTYYRLVTGVLPFDAPTPMAMMYKHKHDELVTPAKYMPGVPNRLCAIIQRMMQKEPEERYPQMQDVVDSIQELMAAPDEEEDGVELTQKIPSGSGGDDFGFDQPAPARRDPSGRLKPVANLAGDIAQRLNHLLAEGDKLRKENRPVAAYAYWKKALELAPNDHQIQQRMTTARDDSTVASIQIASRILEQGKAGEQRRELQQVLKVDPENLDAMERLQALDLIDSRRRAALNELRKILAARQYETALNRWKELPDLLRDPSLQGMMQNIEEKVLPVQRLCAEASELTRKGLLQEALAVWQQASELDGANDQVVNGLQEVQRIVQQLDRMMRDGYECEVQCRFESALEYYERILSKSPTHEQAREKAVHCLGELASALESSSEYARAITQLERLLQLVPDQPEVEERIELLKRRQGELRGRIDKARDAMKRGSYTRAIREWRQVERLQPGSSTAVFGRKAASRSRFYRRFLPLVCLIVVGFSAVIVMLMLQARSLRMTALNQMKNHEYLASSDTWEKVLVIPGWGRFYREEALLEQSKASLLEAMEVVKRLRKKALHKDSGDEERRSYHDAGRALRDRLQKDFVFSATQQRRWTLENLMAEAELALGGQRYDEAIERYAKAREYGRSHRMKLPMHAQLTLEGLAAFKDGDVYERSKRTVEAMASYRLAMEKIPDFHAARERLEALKAGEMKTLDMVKQAKQLLTFGANAPDGRVASAKLIEAQKRARKALEIDPSNEGARRIDAEAGWRLDAG